MYYDIPYGEPFGTAIVAFDERHPAVLIASNQNAAGYRAHWTAIAGIGHVMLQQLVLALYCLLSVHLLCRTEYVQGAKS